MFTSQEFGEEKLFSLSYYSATKFIKVNSNDSNANKCLMRYK